MQNDLNCRFAVRMNRAPSVWEDMKPRFYRQPCPPSRFLRFGASRRSSPAFTASGGGKGGATYLERGDAATYLERGDARLTAWCSYPLPVSRPAGALQVAEPCRCVRQRQLARRPLLREHRLAVVEVPDLDADTSVADVRVDRRVILPDPPQAFSESR